jgi:hypothetical protein
MQAVRARAGTLAAAVGRAAPFSTAAPRPPHHDDTRERSRDDSIDFNARRRTEENEKSKWGRVDGCHPQSRLLTHGCAADQPWAKWLANPNIKIDSLPRDTNFFAEFAKRKVRGELSPFPAPSCLTSPLSPADRLLCAPLAASHRAAGQEAERCVRWPCRHDTHDTYTHTHTHTHCREPQGTPTSPAESHSPL